MQVLTHALTLKQACTCCHGRSDIWVFTYKQPLCLQALNHNLCMQQVTAVTLAASEEESCQPAEATDRLGPQPYPPQGGCWQRRRMECMGSGQSSEAEAEAAGDY